MISVINIKDSQIKRLKALSTPKVGFHFAIYGQKCCVLIGHSNENLKSRRIYQNINHWEMQFLLEQPISMESSQFMKRPKINLIWLWILLKSSFLS